MTCSGGSRGSGCGHEERLVGLAPAQAVLALPDAVLRGLSDAFIATLPEDVHATVRARLRG